ncbi:hypothetical protein ACHAPE_003026 [Trichoderma viride]
MNRKASPKRLSRLKRLFKRNASSPPSSRQHITNVHGSRPTSSSTAAVKAAAEPTEQQRTSLSKSQDLWIAAFEDLAHRQDTARLVRAYIKTLTTVLTTRLSDAEVLACLDDRAKLQGLMRELVEDGQAKLSKRSTTTNAVSAVTQFVGSVKGIVDVAVQRIPQAALPWAGVSIGLQILMNPANAAKSNLDGIAHVVSRMTWYCALTEYLLDKDHIDELESIRPQLEKKILSLYKVLLLYQMRSVCSYYRHRGYEFLRGLANWDHWEDDLKTVKETEDALCSDLDRYIKVREKDMLGQVLQHATKTNELLGSFHQTLQDFVVFQKSNVDEKNKQCLRDLFVVDPQDDMKKIERNKDTLLSEANEWIFQMEEYQAFTDWSNTDTAPPLCRLLWIKGNAGTGKTMLLMSIIRELLNQSATLTPKVSYFFCQGTVKSLNTATATLRCLIWLLLVQQPHLMSHLKSKHDNAGASLFEGDGAYISLNSVFESILKDTELSPVYLVVDALDECEQGLGDLKRLIFTSLKISDKVKWLVSSRPTVDLRSPETEGSLVELDSQKLQNPVNTFIDHKLSVLKARPGYTDEILEQLKKEIIQRAENTFLWVALVFKELDKEDGYQIVVDGMYALDIVGETPSGLSQLYDYIMHKIERGLRKDCEYCKNVLVAATLAFRPLTLSELRVLAQLPDTVPATIVRKCGSFLVVQDETVYLIHQSAKDYFQEIYESRLRPTGMSQGHEDLAMCSIQAMSSDLRRNMYNLDYGFKPENISPPDPDPLASIRYSCVFWVDHLDVVNLKSLELKGALADDGAVLAFLREKFLIWLEGLSLLGNLPEGVDSIKRLLRIARKSNVESQLAQFLEDAGKLIRSHASIIERAPLQAYASALVFTPVISETRAAQWKHRLPFIKRLEGFKPHWDAHRQTLEAGGAVNNVAFSPDGKMIASGRDKSIQLWEVSTGIFKQTLKGHSDQINSVAFSPDGKILASASHDNTIRLWEMSTGSHKQTLEGHNGQINCVAFSPDGKILASASHDNTIRLWEMSTGSHKQTLEGHSEPVSCVDFSPDGEVLASSSHDRTIRLWEVALGSCRQTFEGHGNRVRCVTFSPDGKILASAADYEPVRLWNTTTASYQQTIEPHNDMILCATFAPVGNILAVSLSKNTIQLWDTGSWSERRWFKADSSPVSPLVLSPDSNMLAFERAGETVQLGDIATEKPWDTLTGHSASHAVNAIAFSPDGTTLASASSDHTIRLWDVDLTNRQGTIKGHSDWDSQTIKSLTFSPNGETLVLASDNGFQVWDTATWSCQQTITQVAMAFKAIVVFSPDGKILAVTRPDDVQLWDTNTPTWTCRLTQKGARPFNPFMAPIIAFSSDNKTMATASQDETIRLWLWDATSGSTLWTLQGDEIHFVAFSPDGKTLASASQSGSIALWDTATRSLQRNLTFEAGRGLYLRLAFSHDSKTLALSLLGAMLLWSTTTWECRELLSANSTVIYISLFYTVSR